MLTIEDIRHARLLQLLTEERFPTVQALADAIGKSHAQVSQWKNRSVRRNKAKEETGVSNIDSASARLIEEKTGKERGWMDHDPAYDLPPTQKQDGRPITVRPDPGANKPPAPNFSERTVSESQWAVIQDIEVLPERDELVSEIKAKAKKAKAAYERVEAMKKAASTAGGKKP